MNIRRFEARDRMPVYAMFRESIWDYMFDNGMVKTGDENDLDAYFLEQKNYYIHLEQNASEDWVAEDDSGFIVGWARSIERDKHLQLTHFFVSTKYQGSGIGHALIDRAFPLDRGEQRSIIGTCNPRALALYLRYGVNFQSMAFSFFGSPQKRNLKTDLDIERADSSSRTLDAIVLIDSQVLGYDRRTELEFFMQHQPVFLFRRDKQLAGYAFGWGNHSAGPAAALDSEDMPELLNQIEISALEEEVETLYLTIPSVAQSSVRWALDSGYKMDAFHEVLLAKKPTLKLDRYLLTQSTFTW